MTSMSARDDEKEEPNVHLPFQRSAPPARLSAVHTPSEPMLGAARDGRHDWGAVVAVLLAALIVAGASLGPGTSVADADAVPPPSAVSSG